MDRDQRIKRVGKGEFRSRLSVEDIEPSSSEEYFMIYNSFERSERILVMIKLPIEVPFMDYIFHLKVKDLEDKYLKRYVFDLMYFNEGIDAVGLKKMTGFISRTLVLFNKMIEKPCLTFEELYPKVVEYAGLAEIEGTVTNSDKVVVFQKDTLLSSKERREITFDTRRFRNSYLHQEVIHNKALTMMDRFPKYAVSKREIHTEVANRKGLKTYRSFNKHIGKKTVDILEEALHIRKFKSQKEVDQYEKYLALREQGVITGEIAKQLGVSYSTLSLYSSVYKEFESRKLI